MRRSSPSQRPPPGGALGNDDDTNPVAVTVSFPGAESPLRPQRRSAASRYAAAIRLVAPLGPGRCALYISLLLIGYLAGSTIRLSVPQTTASNHYETSSSIEISRAASAAVGSGGAGASADSAILSATTKRADENTDLSFLRTGQRRSTKIGTAAAAADALAVSHLADVERPLPQPTNRTLRFHVCNGFANQRISIVYGALLSVRLGRTAVVPTLIDNGLQRTDSTVLASEANQVC